MKRSHQVIFSVVFWVRAAFLPYVYGIELRDETRRWLGQGAWRGGGI